MPWGRHKKTRGHSKLLASTVSFSPTDYSECGGTAGGGERKVRKKQRQSYESALIPSQGEAASAAA